VQRVIGVLLAVVLVASLGGVGGSVASGGPWAQSATACSFPTSAVDATDTEVRIEEEPESVVTLNPSAAQMLWEMGAEEKVIGVTKHAMNLAGAEDRTNISRADRTISHEVVVDLDPDLVLAPLSTVTTTEDVTKLRDAGLSVFAYPSATSIDEVRNRTLLTGRLVGECDGAEDTVDWMDERISVVEDAVDGRSKPDALYAFYGYTAGSDTFIHEIIETAGGANLAAEMGIQGYTPLNEEAVLEHDPDWIILNSDSPTVPEGEGYRQTTAARKNQTVIVETNYLNRPGPRIVHGITKLAKTFHPEAYASAVEAAESTDTPTPRTSAAETSAPEATLTATQAATTQDPDPTGADGAGFGALLVIGSLLGGALLARTGVRPPGAH